MKSTYRSEWKLPAVLIALSGIPLVAGSVRVAGLVGGAAITPENARFIAAPVPVVLHVLCAAVFSVLGTFQFLGSFRARRPGWHRISGRILVPCGLVVALSGLWMTLFYPIDIALQGNLLLYVRILVGAAMTAAIALAIKAIIYRDFVAHRAWMVRGYALAQGAGTQTLVLLPVILIAGEALGPLRDSLMTLAWLINIVIAEWIIRR
jgi:uncharacterized membrane protein